MMKTIALAALLVSPLAQAASSEVLVKVLQDSKVAALTKGASIERIEETERFRCPECYTIEIEQTTPAGKQIIQVGTRRDLSTNKLEVTVKSVTR